MIPASNRTEKFKKNELEVALEEHLRTNVSKYQQDSRVTLFYQGVDPASPVKHAGGKAVAGGFKEDEKEKKSRRKTVSKAQQDSYVALDHPTTGATCYDTHYIPCTSLFIDLR